MNICQRCIKAQQNRKTSDPLKFLFAKNPPTDLITAHEMEQLVGKTKATLVARSKKGEFPPPIRQKGKIIGWRRDKYEKWLKESSD